ncbi:MAG: acetate/propionate family kinase [Patescibacteria group bacterium]|nr:acetate/propionate family kinase [Patescibacteria group bacterium]MDD5294648.1 acetate/propionate family kinase [Patescibacteria group bacterium]MDD5554492.1 acetate/propionate family kinase [Patescibacteria group bacterium]
MRVLVCNIGSTSFKFRYFDMDGEKVLARGGIERVGFHNATMKFYVGDEKTPKVEKTEFIPTQSQAVELCLNFLREIFGDLTEIKAVGFKTVQAGEENGSVLLTERVIAAMEKYSPLAPAHNPPYIQAILMFDRLLPEIPLVGVFEPGFHTGRPEYASVYGAPYEWYKKYGLRKYGYHGASLRYVTGETIRILGLDPKVHKIIACHLGGSSSVCAYKDGRSVDTSMGLTPQSGVPQSNRVGDIDAFAIPFIMKKTGFSMEEVFHELVTNGGLKGISGTSGDMRDILEEIEKGGPLADRCRLARAKLIYDIKFYMGAYILLMGGVDAVCFSGGIGQKEAMLRAEVLCSLDFLGFVLDEAANMRGEQIISTPNSTIKAVVLETNEEIIVARETVRVVNGKKEE